VPDRHGASLTALENEWRRSDSDDPFRTLACPLLTASVLRSALFDVTPAGPVTLGAAAITKLAIAAIASYVTAARAMRVDPQSTPGRMNRARTSSSQHP
jgi:hypothetical protein